MRGVMMKILKIIGIALLSIVVLVVAGLFIFIKTFNINRYKPIIIEQTSKALKRPVSLDHIDLRVSLKEGVRARINNFVIQDDPTFSQTAFLQVREAFLGLDALSLLKKEIVLSDIDIQSPHISIVRNAQGQLNVQTIGQEASASQTAALPVSPSSESDKEVLPPSASKAETPSMPFVSVAKIKISGGEIHYLDEAVSPSANLKIKNINIELSHVSHNSAFPLNFSAALFQDQTNLNIQGSATLNLLTQSLKLKDFSVVSNLDTVYTPDVVRVARSFIPEATLKNFPLPETVKGDVRIAIEELSLTPQGLGNFSVDLDWMRGAVKSSQSLAGFPLEISQINLKLQNFSLSPTPFEVFLQLAYLSDAPNLTLEGNVLFDLATQGISLKDTRIETNLAQFPFEKIKESVPSLKTVALPQKLEGRLSVVVQELSAGPKGLEKAKGDVNWQDGVLNIKDVVPGISFDASDIDFSAQRLSLDNNPFEIALKLAYLNNSQNLNFRGTAALNLREQSVTITNAQFKIAELSSFDLVKLKESFLPLKDVPLPQSLSGKLDVDIKELKAGSQGLKDVLLDAILTNGNVVLKDIPPGAQINLSKIDFKANDVSLTKAFPLSVQAAVFNEQPNIFINGNMGLDLANQMVRFKDTQLKNDLSTISVDALKAALVNLKDVPVPEDIRGTIDINFQDLLAGNKGLEKIVGQATLANGHMKLKELAVPVENMNAAIRFDGTKVDMENATLRLGSGSVKAKGNMDDFVVSQAFHADISAEKINLAEIVDQSKAPVKLEGVVMANMSVDGKGLTPPGLFDHLSGTGNVEVVEGKIKDVNVLKIVINNLSMIPNIEERLKAALPEEYKEKLERPDTVLTKVAFPLTINAGKVFASPAYIEADGFVLEGNAQVGFDQAFDLTGNFSANKELSSAMVAGVEELQYLLSEDQRILFPFEVHGRLPAALKPSVDFQYLSSRIIKNKGKEELNKVLDKVFGAEEKPAETAPPSDGGTTQPPPPEEKPIERQLIEGVLDSIFGN
jgi:uncharacterized protein involved in outer membrane biogenesis